MLDSIWAPILLEVFLRSQALLLLLLFAASSVFGQLQIQWCACSGEVSVLAIPSVNGHTCCPSEKANIDSCCHDRETDDSMPCENGECFVTVLFPPLDQTPTFRLRDLQELDLESPELSSALIAFEKPTAVLRAPLLRPPDPPEVALHVLYSTYLI